VVVAVLDASALVGAKNRIALQIAMNRRQFIGIWSPWIIEEMARTLTWHWARQRGISVEAKHALSVSAKLMMDILTDTFIAVDPKPPHPPAWPELRDAGDWPIWATAKLAEARYVVSENTRDFPHVTQWDGTHGRALPISPRRISLHRSREGKSPHPRPLSRAEG